MHYIRWKSENGSLLLQFICDLVMFPSQYRNTSKHEINFATDKMKAAYVFLKYEKH